MTNKYNVQLITDVNGKPMPQYYDETEGVMKPITRDNGEITGDVNANVSFPETQNINGTVSVDNFPATQQVEVTNQKEVQDVNVTNQATSVDVNNFPELQDVSDGQVRAELEQIKETQSQILERLDGQFDAKLKEYSNDKPLPINNKGEYLLETLIDSQSIEPGSDTGPVFLRPTNEMELYLFISIDVQPWEIRWRNQFGSVSADNGFPVYRDVEETHSKGTPAISIPLGYRPNQQGIPEPSDVEEAKRWRLPLTPGEYFTLLNKSTSDATISVDVLRVWR